ncbi:hypothetical protein SISNIDRAFT_440373 [Sistotremastrum niveocremeum HHB9708]|uniref:cysteine--tRNA ligase n=1 Tax=Sistotremastrum niveocremeum HHB9708 TaxID=1314777 RepID=A0A164VAX4_9AGAM|nr:hypothetical protein SISNIDRAFT_440373 [Sistotremastrum niveocremeum HHB9708]
MSTSNNQPTWRPPSLPPNGTTSALPPLTIYNSLTRSKTPFIPLDPQGKKVTWYCCGPTVYDSAHLGHARNYVTTDVLRRIMRDYFGFDVHFVMNVTDIDDKIIKRAREQWSFDNFKKEHPQIDKDALSTTLKAYAWFGSKTHTFPPSLTPSSFESWAQTHSGLFTSTSLSDDDVKLKNRILSLRAVVSALSSSSSAGDEVDPEGFYKAVQPVLSEYLGDSLKSTITPSHHAIFTSFASTWEHSFFHSMSTLNCLPPTTLTRVSEFIPENIKFVEKIVENGFGYEVDGSVYFDIGAFERRGGFYARLEPGNRDNLGKLAEGEGELTVPLPSTTTSSSSAPTPSNPSSPPTSSSTPAAPSAAPSQAAPPPTSQFAKHNPRDFVLWKKSRPGEPSYPSPWGPGRPGWHIECSAMCSEVLGSRVDIHSGGVDLAFPHHDNELAQSEAYWFDKGRDADRREAADRREGEKDHQWVNYFIHMGHLSISGSKMSKSLKNFITIDDALAPPPPSASSSTTLSNSVTTSSSATASAPEWTPRKLRIVFMSGGWKNGIEVTPAMRKGVESWESSVSNFFSTIKALSLEQDELESSGKRVEHLFREGEKGVFEELGKAQANMHAALCDSFNTPLALEIISDLIVKTNIYMKENQKTPTNPSAYFSLAAVKEVGRWITKMLSIFGLSNNSSDQIGWGDERPLGNGAGQEGGGEGKEEIAMPYIRILSKFRTEIKALAISSKSTSPELSSQLLALSDSVRDDDLVNLGVSLEDRNISIGEMPLIKFVPASELLAARDEKRRIQAEKERAKEKAKEERERAEKEKEEKARVRPEEMFRNEMYSEWDEEGIPVKDAKGGEVSKGLRGKLKKLWEKQRKVYEAWQRENGQ